MASPSTCNLARSARSIGKEASHHRLESLGLVGRYRVGTMRKDLQVGSWNAVGYDSGLGGWADPVVRACQDEGGTGDFAQFIDKVKRPQKSAEA